MQKNDKTKEKNWNERYKGDYINIADYHNNCIIILAGITINLVLGENGILDRAKQSKTKTEEAQAKEKLEIVLLYLQEEKQTDKNYNKKDYIDGVINQNKMAITGNIVLVDGWKFEIDREILQITENLGKGEIEAITIITPYIGTTSFLTKVSYAYNEEEIEKYRYIIDDKEIESLEKEYETEDEIEAETIHSVKIVAEYKDGTTLESNSLTIKTEPRTYLYNRGDLCIDITGGWKAMEIDNGANEVEKIKPTITIENDTPYINVKMSSGAKMYGGSISINKEIDYSKFKYLNIVYTASLTLYNSASTIQVYKNYETPSYEENFIETLCYNRKIGTETKFKANISEIEDFKNFYLYLQTYKGQADLNIYEIWLEK